MDVSERVPSFGKEIRESLFYLDREAALTNHGSWGTVPKPVFSAQVALMKEVDTHPDSWFRRNISPRYYQAIDSVAKFIDAPPKAVVLLENATTAVNVILRSLSLGDGDGVLITSLTYGACSNAAKAVCKQTGATLHILEIKLPVVSKEAVVDLYRKYLDDHPDIKFALVDQITSPSAILMPVKEIASLYQSRGVRVMIDGAHSPGQVRLSMREMGADYFTGRLPHVVVFCCACPSNSQNRVENLKIYYCCLSLLVYSSFACKASDMQSVLSLHAGNLHKWVFSPRGCAFLYVREGLEDDVNPLVVSHNHFLSYQERFVQQGTRDYTPYCTAPVALEFYDKIGGLVSS